MLEAEGTVGAEEINIQSFSLSLSLSLSLLSLERVVVGPRLKSLLIV